MIRPQWNLTFETKCPECSATQSRTLDCDDPECMDEYPLCPLIVCTECGAETGRIEPNGSYTLYDDEPKPVSTLDLLNRIEAYVKTHMTGTRQGLIEYLNKLRKEV